MMEWVDVYDKEGFIIHSEIKFGEFVLSVHHYISLDDEHCVLSCEGVFECTTLNSGKLIEAKCQAIAKLQIVLQEALDEILEGCT